MSDTAFKSLKEAVDEIIELYQRYPDGGEKGWFAYCTSLKNFVAWDVATGSWQENNSTNVANKVDKEDIAQGVGDDEEKVISQKAFTEISGEKEDVSNKKQVINDSETEYPSSKAVKTALAGKVSSHSPAFTGNPTGLTKTSVGLSNVNNTSDENKPVSLLTRIELEKLIPKTAIKQVAGTSLTDLMSQKATTDYVNSKTNTEKLERQARDLELTSAIEAVASGSPKGSYPTLLDLETDDPDHNFIYVVVADGKWYYYSTGTSTWEIGGQYQAALDVANELGISESKVINQKVVSEQLVSRVSIVAQTLTTDQKAQARENINVIHRAWVTESSGAKILLDTSAKTLTIQATCRIYLEGKKTRIAPTVDKTVSITPGYVNYFYYDIVADSLVSVLNYETFDVPKNYYFLGLCNGGDIANTLILNAPVYYVNNIKYSRNYNVDAELAKKGRKNCYIEPDPTSQVSITLVNGVYIFKIPAYLRIIIVEGQRIQSPTAIVCNLVTPAVNHLYYSVSTNTVKTITDTSVSMATDDYYIGSCTTVNMPASIYLNTPRYTYLGKLYGQGVEYAVSSDIWGKYKNRARVIPGAGSAGNCATIDSISSPIVGLRLTIPNGIRMILDGFSSQIVTSGINSLDIPASQINAILYRKTTNSLELVQVNGLAAYDTAMADTDLYLLGVYNSGLNQWAEFNTTIYRQNGIIFGSGAVKADVATTTAYDYLLSGRQILNPALPKKATTDLTRILFIGSSYHQDAATMVRDVARASGLNVRVGNIYKPGFSYQQVVDYYQNDTLTDLSYYIFAEDGSAVGITTTKNVNEIVIEEPWDVICIQSDAANAFTWSTYQPYLRQLISLLKRDATNPNVVIAMNHAWTPNFADERYRWGFTSAEAMWVATLENIKRASYQSGIDLVIPCGMAIYSLRTTSLNGAGGTALSNLIELTRDNLHLDGGIGRYAAACTVFEALLKPIYGVSVLGNTYRNAYSSTNVDDIFTPITNANAPIAQRCAISANANRFDYTDFTGIL